jgi:hypothetical protein
MRDLAVHVDASTYTGAIRAALVMLLVSAMSAEPSGRHVRRGISRPQRFQTSVTDTVPCYSERTERTRRDRGRPVTDAPGQPILQAGYYSQQFFFSLSRGVLDRGLVEWPWPVFQPRAGWQGGRVVAWVMAVSPRPVGDAGPQLSELAKARHP